jgi:hypothetical protein
MLFTTGSLRLGALSTATTSRSGGGRRVQLFIAIGSAPGNTALRDAARGSWLRWLPDDSTVEYKFFSDAPPSDMNSATTSGSGVNTDWALLEAEVSREQDIVLQPLATGYGSNDDNTYGQRARYQLSWAHGQFSEMSFFLRIDDDSFLCLHRLLYELQSAPRNQFFWGRFWCREGRNRADENFMFFSGDVVKLLSDDRYVGKIVPFDDRVTMGWNFGYWSWTMNLTIFDDQSRIDAQQGYLTSVMHTATIDDQASGPLAEFCDKYLFAHHVHASVIVAAFRHTRIRMMYPIPKRTTPRQTCPAKDLSFLPRRHSRKLPDVRIGLSDATGA